SNQTRRLAFHASADRVFSADPSIMFRKAFSAALPLAFVAILTTSALVSAEDVAAPDQSMAAATTSAVKTVPADGDHWTAYGLNITAPASMWPMLELLLKQHFD